MPPWGKSEQWTLSVQHTIEDAQRLVDNFRAFAQAVTGIGPAKRLPRDSSKFRKAHSQGEDLRWKSVIWDSAHPWAKCPRRCTR